MDSPQLPRSQWITLGHCAPSAPCPGMTTRCICMYSPPLSDIQCHARGRSEIKRYEASLDRDSLSSLKMPPRSSLIWKGASESFLKNSFLFWPIESLLTRRLWTGLSFPSRATQKANMRCQPILIFLSSRPWRGGICFFWRSSASYKPSTPGPTPGVLYLRMRVRNWTVKLLSSASIPTQEPLV